MTALITSRLCYTLSRHGAGMGNPLIATRHSDSFELKTAQIGRATTSNDIRSAAETARCRSVQPGEREERVARALGYSTVERTRSMWAVCRGKHAPRIRPSHEDEPTTLSNDV